MRWIWHWRWLALAAIGQGDCGRLGTYIVRVDRGLSGILVGVVANTLVPLRRFIVDI